MDRIYLQLFSLGDMNNAIPMREKLASVALIGYDGVEFAGGDFGGLTPAELKDEFARLKLECRSVHCRMAQLETIFPYMQEIGARYAIVASHPFSNREETLEAAADLNRYGKIAAEYGVKVGFHNHTQEFNKDGDEYLLDILIANTDPEHVVFQLDCGWAAAAGIDPVEWLKKHASRYVGIHIKENNQVIGPEKARSPKDPPPFQLDADGRPIFTEEMKKRFAEREKWNCATGRGLTDWQKVKDTADAIGIDLFVVEREASYDGKARIDCLAEDVAWLRSNVK